ncbi:MAG: TonB-dependent receptor [Prevotellaceae bacterium]|nr:TonB-dependent receptor [Prevotellaceae bacterium]
MKKRVFLLGALLAVAVAAFAQRTVTGIVLDETTNEAIFGATVQNPATQAGTVTGLDGRFSMQLPGSNAEITVSYLGYKAKTIQAAADNLGTIYLEPEAVMLNDVVVTGQMAIQRKTPVAVSNVTFDMIQERLGNAELPEILSSTPGVYATKGSGGFGDSRINMRGFKSENVAVMVNGVPMNDMEWGGVYWSNWAGLSDVTRVMQTQRGLGASKVSAPSVGGTINVVTNSLEAKKGGTVSYEIGNDGYMKQLFSVSSGMMENGWAFTVLGAHNTGNGYIQGTEFDAWNYFANIAKRINDRHTLSFTAFGAPQTHYQRSGGFNGALTIAEWQRVGNYMNGDSPYKYNAGYGFANGQRKTQGYNFYHKPQISLNWNWQINYKSSLSTALYTSIGRGGGYSGQGATSGNRNDWYGSGNGLMNTKFRNPDGTFAYDDIYELNESSTSGSQMAMSESVNKHNWYGLISTYSNKITSNIDVYGGVDFRYYKGTHTNELNDLYGGSYYVDADSRSNVKVFNNAAVANQDWVNQKLQVGDVVYRDYDGYVVQEGTFGQVEGTFFDKSLNVFVAGSLSNTSYWRYDRFYYDKEHAKSEMLNFLGGVIKGGANYNFADYHNVFANVGYISRAPFFSGGAFLQATTSHDTNPDAVNEKIFSAELGYGFRWKYLSATLNGYYTNWMDKTMARTSEFTNQAGETDRAVINMAGVDARHMGVELEVRATPAQWIELTGMLSIGDWQWNSNATGYWYDTQGQPLANIITGEIATGGNQGPDHAWSKLNIKGIKVGDAAQTTADLGVIFKPVKRLRIGGNVNAFARLYADYSFSGSNLSGNGTYSVKEPWKVPGAATVNTFASYRFKLAGLDATVSGTVHNLFDQEYISDAWDGGGSWETARVFYGFGRTWTSKLKINF